MEKTERSGPECLGRVRSTILGETQTNSKQTKHQQWRQAVSSLVLLSAPVPNQAGIDYNGFTLIRCVTTSLQNSRHSPSESDGKQQTMETWSAPFFPRVKQVCRFTSNSYRIYILFYLLWNFLWSDLLVIAFVLVLRELKCALLWKNFKSSWSHSLFR